jgi:hypothetical protein
VRIRQNFVSCRAGRAGAGEAYTTNMQGTRLASNSWSQPLEREKKKSEPQGLLYILFAFFGFLAGRSFSKFGTPQDRSANDTAPQSEPTLIAQVRSGPKQTEYAKRRERHTPLWKKLVDSSAAIATVGLLIVNLFSLKATKKAADAAKESADLTRKQMEGVSAAVIELTKGVSVYPFRYILLCSLVSSPSWTARNAVCVSLWLAGVELQIVSVALLAE